MKETAQDFFQSLRESLRNREFIHLVLSRPVRDPAVAAKQADRISIRPVTLSSGLHLQFASQFGNQEHHRNLDWNAACLEVETLFGQSYRNAHLFTSTVDVRARSKAAGRVRITRAKPSRQPPPAQDHNRTREYLIPDGRHCPFLEEIGVMNASGQVRKSKYNKFRQINRFLELVEDVLPAMPTEVPLQIIDFGCGKSYLTFALHYLLTERHSREVSIRGLDLKADVIQNCSAIADRLGCRGLSFEVGSIETCRQPDDVHLTVSLHACDTATDAALAKAIQWESDVILAVPCCQHEFSTRMTPELLPPVQKHGILRERFASLATDSLRALALEILGYRTQVVEFIDLDHTAKNLLIRAVKRKSRSRLESLLTEYRSLRSHFGPEPIALEQQLGDRLQKFLATLESDPALEAPHADTET